MHRPLLQLLRRLVTSALVVLMAIGGLIAPSAVAAQQQSIVSQLTGATITYGPPYQLLPDLVFADENMEMITFEGAADMLAMGFLPPLIDLSGARDVFLEGFFGEFDAIYNLDAGSYQGVSYSLDITNVDGSEIGVFSLFMNNRSHGFAEFEIFVAPPVVFGATMQTVQNTIAIDGVGLFRGVDATVMGNMVVANIGSTGGTAATDVIDVQQGTENQTSTTTGASRDEYLTEVQAEFDSYTTNLGVIIDVTEQLQAGTITAQDARPLMDEAHAILAGANDRANAIAAPAGMESFHAEFLVAADAMTTMGVAWNQFVNGQIAAEDYATIVPLSLAAYSTFATILNAEITSTDTQSPQTDTSTTSGTDAASYLATIQTQMDDFYDSFTAFTESLSQIGDANTAETNQQLVQTTFDEAQFWTTYLDTANAITPPAGYENVHGAYVTWASEVVVLGNTWISFLQGDGSTFDDFSAQLTVVQTAEDSLNAEIQKAGDTGSTDTGSTDAGSTQTGRTTRGATTDVTPEATETTSRTGRTTRGTATDVTPEATETTSRTSRTTRGTTETTDNSLTNISETKGTQNTTGTVTQNDPGEWLAPQFDVLFTWDETLTLHEGSTGSTSSDTNSGLDQLNLWWEDEDGNTALVMITVMAGQSGDPEFVAQSLVDDPALVEQYFGAGAELVDTDIAADSSGMLVHIVSETSSGWLYTQFTCLDTSCSALIRVQVVSTSAEMPLALQSMRRGLSADDVSITDAMRPRTVESAIAEYES